MNLLIFAMLFNGGMIPTFILVKNLGLLNSIWRWCCRERFLYLMSSC